MASLETIADAKVQAAVTRRLHALTAEIVSIKEEMNARGVLQSSMTVNNIHDACILVFDAVRDDIKAEYSVVLNEAFWPTERLTARMILAASRQLVAVANRALGEIQQAGQSLTNSSMHAQLCEDVTMARDRALTDLSLLIDGHSKIMINRRLKRLVTYIPDLIRSVITGVRKSG